MVSIKERFVIVPDVLTDNDQMVILTDYNYWAECEVELAQWCKDNDSDFTGMLVVFPNQKTLTSFCLEWS